MRPVQRQQRGFQYGIYLLCLQAFNFGIDRIPTATLTAIIIQASLYIGLIQVPWNANDVCLSALKIIKYKDWLSFFYSNFEHGSDMHLYYNMISFIMKGSFLEPLYRTLNFGFLLLILSIGCSSMYVFLGYALTQLTGDYAYFTNCAIGFSAILFALKLIALCEEDDRLHNVNGFYVPSKLAVWTELILIHLLVPNSSFIGHLSGILVGCLYCYTFVGELVDSMLCAITGEPVIHEEQFYRRRRIFT